MGDDRTSAAWRALLIGEMVVSEHLHEVGVRTIVARPTGPGSRSLALSRMEVELASSRARGTPLKVLATQMQGSPSSISASIFRARRKLRLRTEADLAAFFLSTEVREGLRMNGERVEGGCEAARAPGVPVRLSYAVPLWRLPPRLSDAEGHVVRELIAGSRASAIAGVRGVSTRTVANQIASAFRKLGVCSRAEMFAALLLNN